MSTCLVWQKLHFKKKKIWFIHTYVQVLPTSRFHGTAKHISLEDSVSPIPLVTTFPLRFSLLS